MLNFQKRFVSAVCVVTLVVGIAAGPALAQNNGGYKIGVVDLRLVTEKYEKRVDKYNELQKEVDARQKEIDALSDKIETAKKDYEDKKNSMSDTDRIAREDAIQADYSKYKTALETNQRSIDRQEQAVLKEVLVDIDKVITAIASAENYHLVFNAKGNPGTAVLYSAPAIDITTKVLEKLNADYKKAK